MSTMWLIEDEAYARELEASLAAARPAGFQAPPPGGLPTVRAAIRAALAAAGDGGGPPACRHVLADALDAAGGPSLCAHHPAAGVLCGPCITSHFAGHPPVLRCDECGRDGWLRPFAQPIGVRTFICRGLDGRNRVAVGPLLVEGLRVCLICGGDPVDPTDAAGDPGAADRP